MAYSSPAAIVTGTTVSKTTFGDVVKADLDYLANPPACRVTNSATQSVADSTLTAVAFDTETYDTDTMHSTVTNNTRITIKTAGLYIVTSKVNLDYRGDYASLFQGIRIGGTVYLSQDARPGVVDAGLATQAFTTAITYKFAVNDYIELVVWQNNAANVAVNVLAAGNVASFAATWVGLG